MFSFVRHSDRSKFSERTTCLHIRGLSIAVFMCTICTRVQIFTREQIYTRVQICTPLCRVHMPINCVHTHPDLNRNLTQGTHFYEKFAIFECCKWQYICIISVYVCKGKGGSSLFRRRSVWLKLLQSIHIKVKSEKHIHNMTKIFYLYDCISFNDLP